MKSVYFIHKCIVFLLFLVAFILQILPWPQDIYFLKPSWVYLIFSSLAIIFPEKINIGTGFTLGIILDLFIGLKFGVQTLSLSILAYLIFLKLEYFQKFSLLKQTYLIVYLLLIIKLIMIAYIYLINSVILKISFFGNILVDAIMWPWIFSLIKRIFIFFKIIKKY
ncbi:MAG: rod shape-determining protein MreD [Wigglesworthia glossinidia]|nr:rod shape-determining protein MreD [Wigglesworthia glossinidia]